MRDPETILRDLHGTDPIAGSRALNEVVALGDGGEEFLFAKSIPCPRTVQALRRLLRYVATRRASVVPRLLARLDDPKQFGDAYSCALLCAGADDAAAGQKLYSQLERGYDYNAGSDRYLAWGYAGGSGWPLFRFVEKNGYLWEKLRTFAFRGACASVARMHDSELGVLEKFVTHEWEDGSLRQIDAPPESFHSNEAIDGSEMWGEANSAFLRWRRGAVADVILNRWAMHDHWRVRVFGAEIMGSLGLSRIVKPVVSWLHKEVVKSARASLLHALERSETAAGADAALAYYLSTEEGSPYVARSAWRASEHANARAALMRIANDQTSAGAEALVSLARMGTRHPGLLDAVESADHYRRVNAALALAYLRDTKQIDRIVAMRNEASTPLESVYLAASLALLGYGDGADRLHEELQSSASKGYPDQVDPFMLHRFLQTAVLEALASGGEAMAEVHAAWRAELEPLDPQAKPVSRVTPVPLVPANRATPSRAAERFPTIAGKVPSKGDTIDVLFVTVNENETKALLEVFAQATEQEASPVVIEKRAYNDLGSVNGTHCMHALSEMGSGGPGGMQQTVEKGIRAFNPIAVICVGVAFGVNEKKQAIGDILLARQLRLYDLQRVGRNQIVLRGDKPHSSTWLMNHFGNFAQTAWLGAPVRPGAVLTGDKLVDNIDYRQQLEKLEPEAVGGEMEGAGLYVASSESKVDWILIKAICDWADGDKSKNKEARQQKAARNAANFVLSALKWAPLRH